MRKILFLVIIASLLLSCSKEDNDIASFNESVWIHQFTTEDKVTDGAAAALYFGENKVEYYALDTDLKILRLIDTFTYQVKKGTIVIGVREGTVSDNYLYFHDLIYYRSGKKIKDLLPE